MPTLKNQIGTTTSPPQAILKFQSREINSSPIAANFGHFFFRELYKTNLQKTIVMSSLQTDFA